MRHQPDPELFNRIMDKIEREKAMIAFRKSVIRSSLLLLITVAGFFVGSGLFVKEAKSSGFFDFISLGFSDFRVISQNFNEFLLSIMQALPIDTLAVILSLLVGMIASIHSLIKALYGFKFMQNNLLN